MAIKRVQVGSIGQSGIYPRIVYIETDDNLSKVTTPGYLNSFPSQGNLISNKDIALVVIQDFPGAPPEVVFLDIHFSNGNWNLVTNSPESPGALGKILRSDGIRWAVSTATFADTYANNSILISNGENSVEGLSTIADAALVTNSAGAIGFATGLAGDVLTSNGAGSPPSMLPLSRGLQSLQVFESSGTWNRPSGITHILVYCIGGGGGSGGADGVGSGNESEGAGGGAGGISIKFIDVSLLPSESVTIGAGGLGGTVGISDGIAGGTSSFGAIISATGGGGGQNGVSTTTEFTAIPGSGGNGISGDINIDGGNGNPGRVVNGEFTFSGFGGNNLFSPITSVNSNGTGNPGAKYGGGAGGALSSSVAQVGGAGGSGACIIYEYIL